MKTILGRIRSFNWKQPFGWAAVIAVAAVHIQTVMALPFSPDTVGWLFPVLLGLPALATMILLPRGYRRWYRWAALGLLFLTTYSDSVPLVLTVGEAWALHRQWVTELDGGIINRFRRTKKAPPDQADKTTASPAGSVFLKLRKPKTA